jgi:hypothetical protein
MICRTTLSEVNADSMAAKFRKNNCHMKSMAGGWLYRLVNPAVRHE